MIYREPGFLAVGWFVSTPPRPSFVRKLYLFLSLHVCRRSSLDVDGRRGKEVTEEPNHSTARKESLALHKSFNTLWSLVSHIRMLMLNLETTKPGDMLFYSMTAKLKPANEGCTKSVNCKLQNKYRIELFKKKYYRYEYAMQCNVRCRTWGVKL